MGSRRHVPASSVPEELFRVVASRATQRGVLGTIAPLMAVITSWLWRGDPPAVFSAVPAWAPLIAAAVAVVAAMAGAALFESRPNRGNWLYVGGIGIFSVAALPAAASSPAAIFALFLASASITVWVTSESSPLPMTKGSLAAEARQVLLARATSAGALVVWLVALASSMVSTAYEWAFIALVGLSFVGHLAGWIKTTWSDASRSRRGIVFLAVTAIAVVGLFGGLRMGVAASFAIIPTTVLFLARTAAVRRIGESPWWTPLVEHPARFLVASFLATAVVGGVVLALPVFHSGAHPVSLLDAMFTAFSATCVTGLIVLDTPVDFSGSGQLVILVLIQLGGLGIMTFSTATIALLGRRMSLRHEGAVAELIGTGETGDLFAVLKRVFAVTFVTEGLGAITLTLWFLGRGEPLGEAVWRGIFTSISAFCNAGFALQSASLVPYQTSPGVLLTVSALIIVGGLGPLAVVAFPAIARRRLVSPQVRIVYLVTAVLLVAPALLFGFMEWSNTLDDLGTVDRVVNSWFQSVTLRTAGFNSVDLAAVHPATLTMMLPLMFVGGSPGSTAGGIKTTTIFLLVLAVFAALRGRSTVEFGRWRIPHSSVYKAAAVSTIGLFLYLTVLILLQLTQNIEFASLAFETVSALATVGLSVGATSELDSVGKVVIIVSMFIGRVGPLTLFLLLLDTRTESFWDLPEHDIAVG